jgi:hypothetical protein
MLGLLERALRFRQLLTECIFDRALAGQLGIMFRLSSVRALLCDLIGGQETLFRAAQRRVGIDEALLESFFGGSGSAQFRDKVGLALVPSRLGGGEIGDVLVMRVAGGRDRFLQAQLEGIARTSDLGNFNGRPRSLLRERVLEHRSIRQPALFSVRHRLTQLGQLLVERSAPCEFLPENDFEFTNPTLGRAGGFRCVPGCGFGLAQGRVPLGQTLFEATGGEFCRADSRGEFGIALELFSGGGDRIAESILARLLERCENVLEAPFADLARSLRVGQPSNQLITVECVAVG